MECGTKDLQRLPHGMVGRGLAVYRDSAVSAGNVTRVGRRGVYVLMNAERARVSRRLPSSFGTENEALTKGLANEFARDNILVNALLTGSIVTDQVANRYKREQPSSPFEDSIANIGKGIPIGRMGTAQEYANLACFLVSDAGSYVTGTAIHLDGGACPVV